MEESELSLQVIFKLLKIFRFGDDGISLWKFVCWLRLHVYTRQEIRLIYLCKLQTVIYNKDA